MAGRRTKADSSSDDDHDELIEPQKKRRKVATKSKGKGLAPKKAARLSRRGLLEQLLGAPLDILYEIFCCLEPLDILRLSRTSKDLRSLLMRESSAFVWRKARDNVSGLPGPPNGITEAQYANLVFAGSCHHCGSPTRFTEMIWELRMRCCKKCIEKRFQSAYWREYDLPEDVFKKVLTVLLGCRRFVRRSRINPNEIAVLEEHYTPGLEKALREYSKLKIDAARQDWLTRKGEEKGSITEWADECSAWAIDRADEQAQIIKEAKAKRHDEIVRRLTELGWGEALEEMEGHEYQSDLRSYKHVNQVKELTEESWAKIRSEMVEWMEDAREARLERAELAAALGR
ncbi:hypothetical protein C8J56DRAFT_974915 [Mycena floridula]|nr:hypothetical protein C8J56DRAFT_974915 [Mycena floridula]